MSNVQQAVTDMDVREAYVRAGRHSYGGSAEDGAIRDEIRRRNFRTWLTERDATVKKEERQQVAEETRQAVEELPTTRAWGGADRLGFGIEGRRARHHNGAGMSADLTEAIMVAADAAGDMAHDWYCPNDPRRPRFECPRCIAEVAVIAVPPIIRSQVAEEIAQAIEAGLPEMGSHINVSEYRNGRFGGMTAAINIARRVGGE